MEQVNDFMASANQHQEKYAHTLWAVELKQSGELIGFTGLDYRTFEAHFTPAVAMAWRLGSQYWGKGYATEGATASLEYGFKTCGLKEIVAFTVPANVRSIRVMEKIGLKHVPNGDFAHPNLEPESKLSHHILYKAFSEI